MLLPWFKDKNPLTRMAGEIILKAEFYTLQVPLGLFRPLERIDNRVRIPGGTATVSAEAEAH